MAWTIQWTERARKSLRQLDPQVQQRLLDFFQHHLPSLRDPRLIGKSLKGNRQGLWRYRVGDYRALCLLRDKQFLVLVVQVAHRREVYKKASFTAY